MRAPPSKALAFALLLAGRCSRKCSLWAIGSSAGHACSVARRLLALFRYLHVQHVEPEGWRGVQAGPAWDPVLRPLLADRPPAKM